MASLKVCLICLDKFKDELDGEHRYQPRLLKSKIPVCIEADVYQRFINFISGYLGLGSISRKLKGGYGGNVQVFCEKCRELVGYICDFYLELEVVKLHLIGKLEELGEVMRRGRKRGRHGRVTGKVEVGLMKLLAEQLNVKQTKEVTCLRNILKVKCLTKRKDVGPKVIVPHGLFPEEWKFNYPIVKENLMRLIVLFTLASPLMITNPEEEIEQGTNAIKEEETREEFFPMEADDDFHGDVDNNDSDWSGASKADSNSSLKPQKRIQKRRSKYRQARSRDTPRIARAAKGKGNVKCFFCPSVFTKRSNVYGHLRRIHSNESEYVCTTCDASFKTLNDFIIHQKQLHLTRDMKGGGYRKAPFPYYNLTCSICQSTLESAPALLAHLHEHEKDNEKTIPCCFCHLKFSLEETRAIHVFCLHRRLKFSCSYPDCNQLYKSNLELNQHLQSHMDEDQQLLSTPSQSLDGNPVIEPLPSRTILYCPTCSTGFVDPLALELHELCHIIPISTDSNDKIKCPKCLYVFKSHPFLMNHYNRSHGLRYYPLKCSHCDRGFSRRKALRHHMLNYCSKGSPSKPSDLTCSYCNLKFATKISRNQHVRRKHREPMKKYICTKCPMSFNHHLRLKNHLMKAHQEGIFTCDVCGKQFIYQNYLVSHMKCHQERKFSCDICGLMFVTIYNLRNHIKHVHEKKYDRTYICDECGTEFKSEMGLHYHVKSKHTDEKQLRFGCLYCPKRYYRLHLFKTHMLTCMKVHGIREDDEAAVKALSARGGRISKYLDFGQPETSEGQQEREAGASTSNDNEMQEQKFSAELL